jgi:hypothetical protein
MRFRVRDCSPLKIIIAVCALTMTFAIIAYLLR